MSDINRDILEVVKDMQSVLQNVNDNTRTIMARMDDVESHNTDQDKRIDSLTEHVDTLSGRIGKALWYAAAAVSAAIISFISHWYPDK